jgi:hypothetical protein
MSALGRKEAGCWEDCWEKGGKAVGRSGDQGGRLLMALNKEKVVGLSSRRMLLKKNNARFWPWPVVAVVCVRFYIFFYS